MKMAALIFASLFALTLANAQDSAPAAPTTTEAAKPADAAKPAEKKTEKKVEAKKPEKKLEKSVNAADPLPKAVTKLVIQDTIPGSGKEAKKGKTIKVNYTGWLYDPAKPMGRGKQFDTSAGSEPFLFELGSGRVIKGWDEGFESMKVGGKRKLIIPSEMAYGKRGAGTVIPPDANLMFEVELVDVM
ncbi:MAG: FKBP-type peptidyl-prolyl cis-trans isomerase [Bdellovibrionota bacterium]